MHALIAQIDALGETLAGAGAPDLRAIGARLREGPGGRCRMRSTGSSRPVQAT
jgi:hypothetical protein